jgi:signal transduction histidine kinase
VTAIDWDFSIAWVLAPVFGLLSILYLSRRDWRRLERVDRPPLVYLALGLLWAVGVLFAHPRIRDLGPFIPFIRLAPYLLALSPSMLWLTTTNLVRSDQPYKNWLLALPLLLAVFAAFHDGALRPDLGRNLLLGIRRFDQQGLWRVLLITTNLIPLGAALWLNRELYRAGWGLVYHNRLRYWTLALILVALGDLLALGFSHPDLSFYMGCLFHLGGATLATATLVIPYLPTTNFVFRRSLGTLVTGLLTFGLLVSVMLIALAALPDNEQTAVLVSAASLAAIVTLLFLPLNRGVQAAVNRLVLGRQAVLQNVLDEYERQISEELDLEQLAETVLSLLESALSLEPEQDANALITAHTNELGAVALTPVARPGRSPLPELDFSPDSPLTAYWQENAAPLAQFDIEVLPDFHGVPDEERQGLAQWRTKLYVPLRSPERLVGVLALGDKRSGAPYTPAEIRFLNNLVGQTVVELEQAQLLSDLKVANAQLTHLSDELAQVNRRLYEANRLKSGFIGVITHELRSPFVAIAFSLQIIERYGLERLVPEQRKQLDELRKGITELKQMIDHIIAFASLLSKQGELKMEQVNLGQVVNEMVEAMQPIARTRRITLSARVWPSLPPVQGDQERLAEAIYHLIHNGIKFNRPDGWVRVRCQPDNGAIEVRVEDSGEGIPAGKLDHLWNEFAQMADPLRRGVEGLGLGLALVRYVAIAHGGEVWAKSTVGEGSTFGFKIPALKTQDRYALSSPRPAGPQRSQS